MGVLIGADPEFFVKSRNKIISAHGLVKGTKESPEKVNNGAVQVDGMALEFNIDPASNAEEFDANIVSVLAQMKKLVPGYDFVFKPVADFAPEYIEAQPEEARKLGCDPDFNAYTGEPNPVPDAGKSFRTASGHIHIGWAEGMDINDPDHLEACRMMAMQLDGSLGVASVVWDGDNRRRELYGKAGAFRPKPYGMEYRTMSNVWVDNPKLRRFVFEVAKKSFEDLMEGRRYYNRRNVVDIINEGDYQTAIQRAMETISGRNNDLIYMLYDNRRRREALIARNKAKGEKFNINTVKVPDQPIPQPKPWAPGEWRIQRLVDGVEDVQPVPREELGEAVAGWHRGAGVAQNVIAPVQRPVDVGIINLGGGRFKVGNMIWDGNVWHAEPAPIIHGVGLDRVIIDEVNEDGQAQADFDDFIAGLDDNDENNF